MTSGSPVDAAYPARLEASIGTEYEAKGRAGSEWFCEWANRSRAGAPFSSRSTRYSEPASLSVTRRACERIRASSLPRSCSVVRATPMALSSASSRVRSTVALRARRTAASAAACRKAPRKAATLVRAPAPAGMKLASTSSGNASPGSDSNRSPTPTMAMTPASARSCEAAPSPAAAMSARSSASTVGRSRSSTRARGSAGISRTSTSSPRRPIGASASGLPSEVRRSGFIPTDDGEGDKEPAGAHHRAPAGGVTGARSLARLDLRHARAGRRVIGELLQHRVEQLDGSGLVALVGHVERLAIQHGQPHRQLRRARCPRLLCSACRSTGVASARRRGRQLQAGIESSGQLGDESEHVVRLILDPIRELDRAGLDIHGPSVDPEVALRIGHEAAEDHVLRAQQLSDFHRGFTIHLTAADELLLVDEPLDLIALDDANGRVRRHLGDEEVGDALREPVVIARVLREDVVVEVHDRDRRLAALSDGRLERRDESGTGKSHCGNAGKSCHGLLRDSLSALAAARVVGPPLRSISAVESCCACPAPTSIVRHNPRLHTCSVIPSAAATTSRARPRRATSARHRSTQRSTSSSLRSGRWWNNTNRSTSASSASSTA